VNENDLFLQKYRKPPSKSVKLVVVLTL